MSARHGQARDEEKTNGTGATYHVICDKLQVTDVNVDLVNGKDAADFAQDGRTRSLDAVSAEQRVDVVGVDAVLVDDALLQVRSEVPDPRQVGAVRRELQAR